MTYCPLEQEEDKAYDCFTRFPVSGHRLGLLYIMVSISICGEQTGNELKLQSITLPSTGHAGDLGDTQLQPRGPRRSTCLDLPGDLVLERLSHLNLLGDLPVQGSQEVVTPQPAQGPNSWEADLPRPAWGFNRHEAVTPQPVWGSAP